MFVPKKSHICATSSYFENKNPGEMRKIRKNFLFFKKNKKKLYIIPMQSFENDKPENHRVIIKKKIFLNI